MAGIRCWHCEETLDGPAALRLHRIERHGSGVDPPPRQAGQLTVKTPRPSPSHPVPVAPESRAAQDKKRRSRKVKAPESDAASAVRHQTRLIIVLVVFALIGWVLWISNEDLNDAKKRGAAEADCYWEHLERGDREPYQLHLPCDDE